MKIMLYENSAGFTSYTHKLCNYLSSFKDLTISYVTSRENNEILSLDKSIHLYKILDNFDSKKKKNSLGWLFNRIHVAKKNIKIRNKLVKKEKFDVINIQETITKFDQNYLKKIKKYSKIIYTVHDVIPPIKSKSYSDKSLKKIYDTADYLIVHTDGNKKQLIDIFGISENKIYVIPHGIETKYTFIEKEECLKRFNLPKDKKIILFYGLIREQKGLEDLLLALKDVSGYKLVIAGSMPHGESFDKYQKIIDKYSINADCYIEYIPNDWTDYLFQAADFVVAPYKYFYSQSGVFMQAIQYRKPVILSDVSSFREFLDKYQIGYICKPSDPDDLSRCIKAMIEQLSQDKNHYLKELEKACKDNCWEESARMHRDVYLKAFKEN